MTGDFHIHTFFSPCAEPTMTPDRILERARAAGLTDIGFADHPYHEGLQKHHEHLHEWRSIRDSGGIRVWIGAELEVVGPEELIIPRSKLPHVDYVLASPSHYDLEHLPPVEHFDDPLEWADRMMCDLENVPGSGADSIAHPFYVHEFVSPDGERWHLPPLAEVLAAIRPQRWKNLLDRLAEDQIALELTPRLLKTPALEAFHEVFYREALLRGVRFQLGSDAHRPSAIGQFGRLAEFMSRVGIGPEHLWHPSQSVHRRS